MDKTQFITEMCILAESLMKQRYSIDQEKQTQMDVERFLKNAGYKFQRENRLSISDIPDFFIELECKSKVVLEIKTRYPKKAIFRQLERYAAYSEVDGIILLTGTSMGLPPEINDKPAIVLSLGAAWL